VLANDAGNVVRLFIAAGDGLPSGRVAASCVDPAADDFDRGGKSSCSSAVGALSVASVPMEELLSKARGAGLGEMPTSVDGVARAQAQALLHTVLLAHS